MSGWMILWTILLTGGVIGMVGLLLGVSVGAFREMGESLSELAADQPDSETPAKP